MNKTEWTTGQLSGLTGVTVRALRYYDRIGLLKPSRVHNGVRLYRKEDLIRLQKISTLKFIGLSLDDIQEALGRETEGLDLRSSLFLQRQLIRQKIRHMQRVEQAVDRSIDALDRRADEPDWMELADIIQTARRDSDWSDQYLNAARLQARTRLYDRFSVNPAGWHHWLFDHVLEEAGRLQTGAAPGSRPLSVLDIGCGDASLWSRNRERIPADWDITLADASSGMLDEARAALEGTAGRFRFLHADIQALPFPPGGFDLVFANHMLYHVEDLDRAGSDLRRVLRPSGRLFASTMTPEHLREMGLLAREFDSSLQVLDRAVERFSLNNGAERLAPFFEAVRLIRYEDALEVNEAGPLIGYMTATAAEAGRLLRGERLEAFAAFLESKITEAGKLRLSKDMGFFLFRPLLP